MPLHATKDRNRAPPVQVHMKLKRGVAPLSVALLAGIGCVPDGHRGPAATQPNDSATESAPPVSASVDAVPRTDEGGPLADPARAPSAPPVQAFTSAPPRPLLLPHPPAPYRVRVVDGAMHDLPLFHRDGRAYMLG